MLQTFSGANLKISRNCEVDDVVIEISQMSGHGDRMAEDDDNDDDVILPITLSQPHIRY